MTETVSGALAKTDNTPSAMVRKYSSDFTSVLPSHVKPETWMRLATGALKRGKKVAELDEKGKPTGRQCTELELAARNNPAAFMAALLESARLGLEPGTEAYYLTPRKEKGRLEILGIVGYQGYIELMYRAGAVTSVVAEVVYEHDRFRFRPGVDEIPYHEIDWDSDDRGKLRLVYAFARMVGGATSKVVVMNRADIAKIKATAYTAEGSIWAKHEPAMWLKSAVRQLRKWVPTSPEWLQHQIRAAREAGAELPLQNSQGAVMDLSASPEVALGDVVDAEFTEHEDDTEPGWPNVATA